RPARKRWRGGPPATASWRMARIFCSLRLRLMVEKELRLTVTNRLPERSRECRRHQASSEGLPDGDGWMFCRLFDRRILRAAAIVLTVFSFSVGLSAP